MEEEKTKYGLRYVAGFREHVRFTDLNDQVIEVRQNHAGLEIRVLDGTLHLSPVASNVIVVTTGSFK